MKDIQLFNKSNSRMQERPSSLTTSPPQIPFDPQSVSPPHSTTILLEDATAHDQSTNDSFHTAVEEPLGSQSNPIDIDNSYEEEKDSCHRHLLCDHCIQERHRRSDCETPM